MVNAVECGVAFQGDIKKRNTSDKTEVKLEFRIGINVGDVVKKEGNLFGDGVNIAARLEALAQPNGISVSKSVYDLVVPKTKMTFNDLGVQKVKQNEFHAFDIILDPSQKRTLKTKSKSMIPIIGTVAAVLVGALLSFFFLTGKDEDRKFVSSSKPVILVMPIKSSGLSEDKKGFADGVTESMISTLSGYRAINVLSSSTSFHAEKTKMVNESIRDEFGVDYLIRGSMQVMGNNARLNLEITELDNLKVSVSKKKDFLLTDIFKVQDELSNEILNELQISLGVGAGQGSNWTKDYNSMEDFNLFLNWREEWRKFSKSGYINSLRMFEKLKSSYPSETRAILVQESWQLYQKVLLGLSKSKEKDLERLALTLNRAIELDPTSPDAFAARSVIGLRVLNSTCEESLSDISKVEEIGSTVDTLTIAGAVYELCGDIKNGIEAKRNALLLVPNDTGWFITSTLVFSLYKDGQINEIYKLIGDDIYAKDMPGRVIALFAFLEQQQGNSEKAKELFQLAKKNNFDRKKFDRQFNAGQKELLEKTINGLLELGSLE